MKMPKFEERGNTWTCRLSYVNEFGKRIQPRLTARTKGELKKAVFKTMNEINQGTFIEPSTERLGHFMEEWLASKKVRKNTYDTYKYLIDTVIKPELGNILLIKINPYHLEKFYKKLRDNYSDWFIFKVHTILSMTFNRAKLFKVITNDPTELVETPKVEEKEMDYWDEEEAKNFFSNEEVKNHRLYMFFLLPFTTGIHQGELLGLQFDDIDFDNKCIEIKRTAQYKYHSFGPPKTKKSRRKIAIDDYTSSLLKKHCLMIKEEKIKAQDYDDQKLVFCTKEGSMYNPSNLRREWYKLIDKTGTGNRKIRYHDLRHTHATHMLQVPGVDIKMVSERLGHSNIGITLKIYYHVMPGKQEEAAQNFGEYFFNNAVEKQQTKL